MSEEEMNDNLLMLKYFLKEEGDENWEDYCNAINKALNLISNLQKENEELKQDNIHQWEERCKLTFELEKNEADIEIKDKVIEKAFKYIDEHTYRDMEECEFGETNNLTCIKDCDTCIKQYFYKQVEKVGGEDE